jgi:hypothetical protein
MRSDLLLFNGIDPRAGTPLRRPLPWEEVAPLAPRGEIDLRTRAPLPHVDLRDLSQAGWGVIFAADTPPAVRSALQPLLRHRREQIGPGRQCCYRECTLKPGESYLHFLTRHGAAVGAVDPERMPYYLLLVGTPRAIPYSFQYKLDIQHGVGRLDFVHPDDYASYVRGVLRAERKSAVRPRRAVFFGPRHPEDAATRLAVEKLLQPLADELEGEAPPGWTVERYLGAEATRDRLGRLLGGEATPSLLFVAGHGLGLPAGDPLQPRYQGALLCQDWPGQGPVREEQCFAAEDVGAAAELQGLIGFFFSCYSAGTTRQGSFSHLDPESEPAVTPEDSVAGLPRRLLGHPEASALAFIGHVDQAWDCSFHRQQEGAGGQIQVFAAALAQLMQEYPVGAAMELFGQCHAELAAHLAYQLEGLLGYGETAELQAERTAVWLAHHDARNYVVLGDPAVRL